MGIGLSQRMFMMENTQNKPNTSLERRPYVRPEIKKLGKLNLLIKGSGSYGGCDGFPFPCDSEHQKYTTKKP